MYGSCLAILCGNIPLFHNFAKQNWHKNVVALPNIEILLTHSYISVKVYFKLFWTGQFYIENLYKRPAYFSHPCYNAKYFVNKSNNNIQNHCHNALLLYSL